MANKPTAILVLGMHRSGTSALTRVLSLLDLDLPSRLMPPVGGNNETGFWESLDIAEIHDRLLAEMGSSWDDCLGFPAWQLASPTARKFAKEISAVLERDFSDSSAFVIKDPRICRFLPFWIEILEDFGAHLHLVLIERHPLEVAASLATRDRFGLGKSLQLWLRHVLDMERDSRGSSRSLITYPGLLGDWRGSLGIISEHLEFDWPRDIEAAAPEIERFLSATLRHHHIDEMNTDDQPVLYAWASQIHDAFCQTAVEDTDPSQVFDRVRADLDAAEKVFAPAVTDIQAALRCSVQDNQHRLSDLQRTSDSEIARLIQAHEEDRTSYENEVSRIFSAHESDKATYEAEIARNRGLLEEFDSKIYELRDSNEELVGERDRLLGLVNETQSAFELELAAIQSDLEGARTQIVETRQTQEESERENDRLRQELDDLQAVKSRLSREVDELTARESRQRADLESARTRVEQLKTEKLAVESRNSLLSGQLGELEETLETTSRDKDWLWEQWHLTKDELEAPRASKVGRLIWWQWRAYRGLRGRLVGLRNSLGSGATTSTPNGAAAEGDRQPWRLWQVLLRACRSVLRLATRAIGWIFLSLSALAETLRFALRGLLRRSTPEASELSVGPSASRRPRVLLVSPYPIYPANHGGGVRLFNLVQRLSEASELHLLIFSSSGEDPAQREALSPWARSVHFHHWQPRNEPEYWELQPPNAKLFASDDVARQIAHLLASKNIDILQLEYTELGQYGLPRFAGVKVVLTEHDLAYRQHWRRRKMGFHHRYPEGNAYGSSFGDWLRLSRYELAVCRRADQIHVMSDDDGQALSRFMADDWERIRVVPNAVDTAFYDPAASTANRAGVLYVGNFQNLPNIDALEHLVEEIWPLIRTRLPDATLSVLGAHPSERVTRFDAQDGIQVIGAVPDLRPYYHGHRLMVAPIRAGSGTRLKILEAFAAGLPVVSTTLGAEGIDAESDRHLLRAEEPDTFAAAVIRLLQEDDLADQLSKNALQLVRDSYDWQRSADATLRAWDELLTEEGGIAGSRSSSGTQPTAPTEDQETTRTATARGSSIDISIVIPTLHGGEDLQRCLEGISQQHCDRSVEIICVDSGSPDSDLRMMRRYDAAVVTIDPFDFDHGLTRDLGAARSQGEILVFLNQDAVPEGPDWLSRLTKPLFENPDCAAVQGGMREVTEPENRFFWDSCGDRFYFTRESDRWLERYYGIGFSTVNAAIRRSVWESFPFGRAPIMEDKKWQKQVVDNRHVITAEPTAMVIHTHNYELGSLWRRCLSEGFGWRLVGERYSLLDMVRDGFQIRMHKDLLRGLGSGRIRSSAELLFPWLRPFALYWGNHWSRGVKL